MTGLRDRFAPPGGLGREAIAVLSLMAAGFLAHGLLVIKLGFYWDDWPLVWIHHSMGPEGFAEYFKGNRPVLGQVYRLLFPVLGLSPLKWGLLALTLRVLGGVALYSLIRGVWRESPYLAWLVSVFALLYPGFSQQSIAVTYSPTHLAFLLFAISMSTSVWAQSLRGARWVLTTVSIGSGIGSYLIVEYFIGLELLRPLIFMMMVRDRDRISLRESMRAASIRWIPYLPALLVFVAWRIFFFRSPSQDNPHMYDGLGQLQLMLSHPLAEIGSRILLFVTNILNATVVAWGRAVGPDLLDHAFGKSVPISWFVGLLVAVCGLVAAWTLRPSGAVSGEKNSERTASRAGVSCVVLGLFALVLGGLPNVFANLPIDFAVDSYGDRYSLPYLLGSCLVLAGVVSIFGAGRRERFLLVPVILMLMGSVQFRFANHFRADWSSQKILVSELAWRAPSLKKGTSVFVNDLPRSLGFNHAAGLLNLMYNETGSGGRLDYFIFSIDWLDDPNSYLRTSAPWSFKPERPLIGRLRYFEFTGNTDQSLVVCKSPGSSLKLLDGYGTSGQSLSDPPCLQLSMISDPVGVIQVQEASPAGPLLGIMGLESESTWGYFYQKADLARQFADWERVVALGGRATELDLYPEDQREWIPFIVGYLRLGQVDSAARLSLKILDQDPMVLQSVSEVWNEALRAKPELGDAMTDVFRYRLLQLTPTP